MILHFFYAEKITPFLICFFLAVDYVECLLYKSLWKSYYPPVRIEQCCCIRTRIPLTISSPCPSLHHCHQLLLLVQNKVQVLNFPNTYFLYYITAWDPGKKQQQPNTFKKISFFQEKCLYCKSYNTLSWCIKCERKALKGKRLRALFSQQEPGSKEKERKGT